VLDGWQDGQLWSEGRCEKFSGAKDKGHDAEFAAFVNACKRGGPWPIPFEDIYGVSWASLSAIRSLREGNPVSEDVFSQRA